MYIASGSSDQSIMIWEFASGKLVQVLIIVFPLAKVSDESLPLLMIQTLRGHEHVVEAVSYGRKPVDAATIVALSSPVRSTEIMVSSLALLLHQAFIHHTSSMHVLSE